MKVNRQAVFDRTGGKCAYCGCKLGDRWHVDHYHPVRRPISKNDKTVPLKNSNDPRNLLPSCPSCNILKGSMKIEDFRWYVGNLVKSLNRDINQYKVAKRYGLVYDAAIPVLFEFEKIGISMPEAEELRE